MAYSTPRDLDRLALPAGQREVYHFDQKCRGLSVRIQRTGKPAFVVWFTVGGKRKKIALGAVGSMTLEDARRRAGEIVNDARDGRDAVAERRRAKAEAARGIYSLGDLISDYLADHAERNLRPRSLVAVRRALEHVWKPLHGLPADAVTRRDVAARVTELARGGPAVANRARASLSAAYTWAIREGLADANPVSGTKKQPQVARDRVLSMDELHAIWAATGDGTPYSRIVRLLVLTGCRREEVGGLTWAELEGDTWHLPAARSKNGKARDIALCRQARAIIDAVPKTGPYLFGRGGASPFGAWSRNKARLDRLARLPAAWRAHDVRRSAATHLAELGIAPPHIVEAILGHLSGHKAGIAGIYNRASYLPEQRIALQAWADLLGGGTAADNVLNLRSARSGK